MADLSRNERKRKRTRVALLDATRKLAQSGDQSRISVQDITEEADVGLGTFYNYFENKQAVFEAVLDDFQEVFDAHLTKFGMHIKDPAMLMAATLKYTFQQALHNEDWRIFLEYSSRSRSQMLQQCLLQCAGFIQAGVKAGRFRIGDIHFTLNLMHGMVHHVIAEIDRDILAESTVEEAIRGILRMLGLADVVARALAQSPLPPISAPRRTPLPEVINWKL